MKPMFLISLVHLAISASCGGNCVDDGHTVGLKAIGARCCNGDNHITLRALTPNSDGGAPFCQNTAPGDVQLCTVCGNGVCSSGENVCNCPQDCK